MARSKKKTPVTGNTGAVSEKQDKRLANRAERRINKTFLSADDEDAVLKEKREVRDVWSFDKDGKGRFCPKRQPKEMRK